MSDVAIEQLISPAHKINPAEEKIKKQPQIDALLLAYLCIFESVQIDRDTAQIQSKGLEASAAAQNKVIALESGVNFAELKWSQLFTKKIVSGKTKIVPKKVAQTILDNLEMQNQEVSAIRGVMEDHLTVLRQGAQVNETNLNSVMDEDQQSVQQGASLMQMLTSLTNQISRI